MITLFFLIFSNFFSNTITYDVWTADGVLVNFTVEQGVLSKKNNISCYIKTTASFLTNNVEVNCKNIKPLNTFSIPFFDLFFFFPTCDNRYNETINDITNFLANLTFECDNNYIINNGILKDKSNLYEDKIFFK